MSFTYPSNDLQDPAKILSLLGSLWTDVYAGRDLLQARVEAVARLAEQSYQDFTEMCDGINRLQVPVYHREEWYALRLLESDVNQSDAALWKFDDAGINLDDSGLFFDTPLSATDYTWAIPKVIKSAELIQNRITEPSVVLFDDIDYQIKDEGIIFVFDPFDNDLIPKQQVFANGIASDRELVLWLFRSSFDWDYIYQQFGYILGLKLASSENYKEVVNAAMDAIAGATATKQMERLVSMLVDIPLVVNDSETVAAISEDPNQRLVITDKVAYGFPKTTTPSVSVGDTVLEGDSLIEEFQVIQFARGSSEATSLLGIVVGQGLLGPGFLEELFFENKKVSPVITGAFGQERLEFEIQGHPLDTALFWDTVHANRLVYGQSLHELMKASAAGVPSTVNPMNFLIENVLRNNAFAIRAVSNGFGPDALGFGPGILLRRITPPHTLLLIIVELPALFDSATMDNVDDTVMGTFDALEPLTQSVAAAQVTHDCVTARVVGFTCQ
jgi:hypothetical protein